MARDLVFLHCRSTPRCIARVDKVFDYFTLQLMTRGRIELCVDGKPQRLGPTAAWPCYPGPRIAFHPAERGGWWSHRYAAFHGPRVARWREQGLLPAGPIELGERDATALAECFDRLIADVDGGRPLELLRAAHTLEDVLLRLAEIGVGRQTLGEAGPTPAGQPPWLDALLQTLDDLQRPDPDYHQLAADHAMALSTLRRRFRSAVGIPLHAYRLSRKMAAARRLLVESDRPLQQVADELGYRDVYYFCRQFTAEVGVSPGRYRRSRQDDRSP